MRSSSGPRRRTSKAERNYAPFLLVPLADSYPKWQAWMRERQPRLLVIWGKYAPSFDISEPEAYRRDVPNAEVHILDAGHFALDTNTDEIAALIGQFMKRQK